MGETITHDIDLRPLWLQWAAGESRTRGRSRALLFGGAAAVIAILLFAFSSASEPHAAKTPAIKAPRKVEPRKVEPPIIIHATREADESDAASSSKIARAIVGEADAIDQGAVRITSEPNVWVFEGETRLGRTPLEIKLEAGRHEIRYLDKAKDLEVRSRIDVRVGQTVVRDLNFGIGTLRIDAAEGTKGWIGTRFVGEAPFKKIELCEGRHRLRLKRGSETVEEWVAVPASRIVEYRVHFAEE
jgi:hypothetical protein